MDTFQFGKHGVLLAPRFPYADPVLVCIPGDHRWRTDGEFGNALEHIFRRIGGKVGDQFVVDGQVGRQHKKVPDAVGQVQVADKSAHQTRFAHTGGQGKAQGGKLAFKIRHRGKLALDRLKLSSRIGLLSGRGDFGDTMEDFQRAALGRPQAETAGDGINMSVHSNAPGYALARL